MIMKDINNNSNNIKCNNNNSNKNNIRYKIDNIIN